MNIAAVAADVVELDEPVAEEAQVALELSAAEVTCVADGGLIARALANRIDNAIKYSDAGGASRTASRT